MIARIPSVPRSGPAQADLPAAAFAPPHAPLAMPVQTLTGEPGRLRRLALNVIDTLAGGLRRSG